MLLIVIFILGAAIGSFLNVLIDRLPNNQSINGRSRCDHCHKKIAWYDLVPVVSYIMLGGKCRYCKKKLSLQYPMVEIITGTLFFLIFNFKFLIFNQFLNSFQILNFKFQITSIYYLISYLGIISCLIVIFFTDAKYHLIPDQIQIALFIFSLVLLPQSGLVLNNFLDKAVGAIAVTIPIYFLYWITKGRGMGFGDVKLAFIIGFLLGIKAGFIALYIAFIMGAVVGLIFMLLGKRGLKSKIAFGPFLVLGIFVMMIWKEPIFLLFNKIYGF